MLHELGHVVGIGTKWNEDDLDNTFKLIDTVSNTYTGTMALAAWRSMGCTGGLPLSQEMDHWNEDCMFNELMSPTLKNGHKAIVSSITMGALEDLGYVVDPVEQDDFGLANLGTCGNYCPAARRGRRGLGVSYNATTTRADGQPLQLSEAAELSLLHAAADSFREHARLLQETRNEYDDNTDTQYVRNSISYIYEENGHYFSRIVHKHQVEHLL